MNYPALTTQMTLDLLNAFTMRNQEYLVATDYYEEPAGQSEYRLYSYLSTMINDSIILDIGTLEGRSAIAWSHNDRNHVISYNLFDQIPAGHRIRTKHNVEFRVGNVLDGLTPELLRRTRIVMIDIDHYGAVEWQIMQKLSDLWFNGIVILDDLFRHPDAEMAACMAQLWADVDTLANVRAKYDLSELGHWTGTGLVVMGASGN